MIISYDIPTQIYIRDKNSFFEEMMKMDGNDVLLVLSNGMEMRAELSDWIKRMEMQYVITRISKTPSNPTDEDLYQVLKVLKKMPQIILAIGGGSVIDLCKGILALGNYIGRDFTKEDITNSISQKTNLNSNNDVMFIAVPTTAGTGSEVTSWGTIWRSDKTAKMSVDLKCLVPTKAYLVYELTKYMPQRLTLATGLDSLSHALESYWSQKSNSITRELSKTAIRLIVEYLPKVLGEPENLLFREKMCMASLFSGLAFANTRTTACHSISYPLTMNYGIEHGYACAITLLSVMSRNKTKIYEYEQLLDAFHSKDIEDIRKWMRHVCSGIVELKLQAFGLNKYNLQEIVERTFTSGRIDNNPIVFNEKEIYEILLENF